MCKQPRRAQVKAISAISMSDDDAVSSRSCVLSLVSIAGNGTASQDNPLAQRAEGFVVVMLGQNGVGSRCRFHE